ncbi:hypothetical protein INS49_004884 [Diaporthe citri]|uniref:uncharacterized protein n=1 Tax=Diaporthe citri TaxID=83186 RepID=UPI001C7FAF98|nr:uncharacterized protein INS49_004884 [Diaporthe citri]KAG6354279.1 hypothetical protein INS49_004884 [Diaporthe citri]
MADIFRDAPAGHLIRFLTGDRGKLLTYADERPGFEPPKVSGRSTPQQDESNGDVEKQSAGSTPGVSEDMVNWYDDNDQDNPQNWSLRKKIFVLSQIMLLNFSVYIGSSIIVPAEPRMMEMWGISQQSASLSLSMYVLGYGVGPMFFSPISEMPRMGRNTPYITSLFLFVMMTVGAATVNNFPGLVVFRFLQGLVGGPVLATGGASATDLFSMVKGAYAVSAWSASGFAGPALGPMIAAFAVAESTWRWPMYETLILNGFTFTLLLFFLPETNPDTILLQRAQRLRKLTGNSKLRSDSEIRQGEMHVLRTMGRYLTTPFKITVQDPSIAFIHIYTALTYAIYWFIYEPYTLKHGIGVPETRLVPGIYAAAAAPTGVFIFAWTARPEIHWMVPTIGVVIYSVAQLILLNFIFIYLPTSYPRYAASLFAANTFLRSALACAAVHFSHPLFENLGIGAGCSVLGALTGACFFGIVALWHYGPQLRARGKFAETY